MGSPISLSKKVISNVQPAPVLGNQLTRREFLLYAACDLGACARCKALLRKQIFIANIVDRFSGGLFIICRMMHLLQAAQPLDKKAIRV